MTVQQIAFLLKVKKVQKFDNERVVIDEYRNELRLDGEPHGSGITIDNPLGIMRSLLPHFVQIGWAERFGDHTFSLTHKTLYLKQTILSSIVKNVFRSIFLPIIVAFITALLTTIILR